ncbi:hypothetical protein [Sphingobacterium multivorum]|uniref:hypothetical protein n=1 Tax=Sphingobacterium multivorum TaxID=28454 RepID=UPI0028A59A13|nr:hypothetical protein [Sphingobacterium multivorum]
MKLRVRSFEDNNAQIIRVVSLGILSFQGFGIRIFENVFSGAIVLWTVLLLILNYRSLINLNVKVILRFVFFIVFYFVFCVIKKSPPSLYLLAAWLSSLIVLSNYLQVENSFSKDLYKLTKFCVFYSLLHIPIMVLFKSNLMSTPFNMNPKTFLYLFYFNKDDGFFGLPRIQGFAWEPSCWNLLLNINVLLALYFKKSRFQLTAGIVSVISVMSTTGLSALAILLCLYSFVFGNKESKKYRFIYIILLVALAPFIYVNIQDKLSVGSGTQRLGDVNVATAIMESNPFLGADVKELKHNKIAIRAKEETWGDTYGDFEGYMNEGITNAVAGMFIEWGLVLSTLFLFFLFKNPLFPDKRLRFVFAIVLLVVLFGTPIFNTGFVFISILSYYLMPTDFLEKRKRYLKYLKIKNNENIYSNRYI